MKKGIVISGFVIFCTFLMGFLQPGMQSIMKRGELVYKQNCLSCHMEKGAGVPRLNPPLIKSAMIAGDKNKLIALILKGSDEHREINGEVYTNVMAPLDFLKDQEIADVLTYIRNSFGNKASIVTVREVKIIRAEIERKN